MKHKESDIVRMCGLVGVDLVLCHWKGGHWGLFSQTSLNVTIVFLLPTRCSTLTSSSMTVYMPPCFCHHDNWPKLWKCKQVTRIKWVSMVMVSPHSNENPKTEVGMRDRVIAVMGLIMLFFEVIWTYLLLLGKAVGKHWLMRHTIRTMENKGADKDLKCQELV